jgi:adenylate cyclase
MANIRGDDTARLLQEREARSLMLLISVVLAGYVIFAVHSAIQFATLPRAVTQAMTIVVYFGFSIALGVVILYLLHRRRWVTGIGYLTAFLAATFAAAVGMVMWKGFVANAPVVILTKLPVALAGASATAAMILTLRPAYGVIVGAGTTLTLIGFYLWAAHEPNAVFARGDGSAFLGSALSSSNLFAESILVVGITVSAAVGAHFARSTIREAIALQRTTDQLSRYFSPEVARSIREAGDAVLKPGGSEQDVVVLFSDLSGFTRYCATVPASEALAMLAEYHERMVEEIFRAGGTLDKFMGDGIMATFGTPLPSADAADRAVRAARGMVTALAPLNEDRARRGLPPLSQRIGIHAGPAIVGNVGTSKRLEFTVIGDTVNVAKRIEAACKKTGHAALVSSAVVARLKERTATTPLGPVALEGQPAPVELHALT